MRVYRPLQSNVLTQGFGENKACVSLLPPDAVVPKRGPNCPVGFVDLYRTSGLNGHNGWDMACWRGEPLYFPVVAGTEWYALNHKDARGGLGLDIISLSSINGNYQKFRFWHLKESAVTDDQRIVAGQYLGRCDSTGASSTDHLHWAKKHCDESGRTINTENGYLGAVDFSSEYEDRFVLDVLEQAPLPLSAKEGIQRLSFRLTHFFFP